MIDQISFTPDGKGLLVLNKYNSPGASNMPAFFFPLTGLVPSSTFSVAPSMGTDNFAFVFDTDGTAVVSDTNPFGGAGLGSGLQVRCCHLTSPLTHTNCDLQLLNVNTAGGAGALTWDLMNYWNITDGPHIAVSLSLPACLL